MPIGFLDGGRIVTALSPWLWLVGLAVLLFLTITQFNFILLLILVLSAPRLFSLFRRKTEAEQRYFEVTPQQRLVMGLLYFGAALTSFFTELILTNSLTFLLGFSADDPTGRAMGAAFAASLLVFGLIFERLRVTGDPWSLFLKPAQREKADASTLPGEEKHTRSLRIVAGVALVLALLGIGVLQGAHHSGRFADFKLAGCFDEQ